MELKHYSLGTTALLAGLLFSASGQVAAQQSASAAAMLEEVVVTARRREETLADLPLSVAAITADAMQAQGIYDIMDISDHIPNVNFTNTGRRGITALFIRGIGNDSPGSLQPVGAGTYVDGHYLPNTVGNMLSTVDIERIEVLRGPQGTLFGKNTTGGAINIISAKPGPEFEADILARAGDYGRQDVRGMINIPIGDTVATRFSFAKEQLDGWWDNNFLGVEQGGTDLEAFSAAVRFTPNDNWIIDLSARGNYQEDDNAPGQCATVVSESQAANMDSLGFVYGGTRYPDDQAVGQWGGGNGHVERLYAGATLDLWNACDAGVAAGDYVTMTEKLHFLDLDNTNLNATIEWDSAGEAMGLDNVNIKVIASTHETEWNYIQDRDYSPVPIDAIGTPPIAGGASSGQRRETESLELLFTADATDRVSFILGANIFFVMCFTGDGNCLGIASANIDALSDPLGTISLDCMADGGTQFDWLSGPRANPGGPYPAGMSGLIGSESTAFFGHLTWALNDDWTLDFGARYTDEDRTFHQVELQTVRETCTFGLPGDPPTTDFCQPDYVLNYASVFEDGFYNDTGANFTETTPMISLTRNVGDDGMVYGLISKGFLSGSFNDELNINLVPELTPLLAYDPETVVNYELGFKGSFADGRVRIAADVFYMDYKDKQETVNIDNFDGRFGGDPDVQITTNAATVEITGIEFELRASLWDGGFVSLDLGWLDDEFSDFFSIDPNDPGNPIDLSNTTRETYSADWTINASIEHAFVLGSGATLTPQLGVYWQDDYDFFEQLVDSPPSFCNQPSYAKFRARATYVPSSGNWQASLFGNNITDETYFEWCDDGRSGTYAYRYGPPSQWGLEFNYSWGN